MRRSAAVAAAVSALTVLLVGCASIPTSGPVEQRGEVRTERDDPFVRVLARGPVDGMSQEQVLLGFLRASASFDDDHAVARTFLAPEAAAGWDPNQGAVIYADDDERTVVDRKGNVLALRGREVGAISARGEYVSADTDGRLDATFALRQVGGEWRISDLPNGLFLTPLDVNRSYRSFDLYFLDPTGTRLVPNAIRVPVGPFASTTLVTALLEGPTDWLAPAVRTAFPEGTLLALSSAPVQDGVVQVDLNEAALSADLAAREALSAQLVWTLRQLPDVSAVRITAAGAPMPGVPVDQRRDAWPTYAPDGVAAADAYVARKGRLLQVVGEELRPVAGKLGDGSVPATDPAVSPEGDQLAALSITGDTLYLTTPTADAPVRARLTEPGLTSPSWDPFGAVWTASRRGKGSAIWAVRPGDATAQRVEAPQLNDQRVIALRVARDGVRVAVVVGARDGSGRQLLVGRVERSPDRLVLAGLRRVESTLVDVADVAWADADRLAVVGREPNGLLQARLVEPDGQVNPAAGSLSGIVRIAAAPGRPLLAATADGTLWADTDVGWQAVGEGTDPAYPG